VTRQVTRDRVWRTWGNKRHNGTFVYTHVGELVEEDEAIDISGLGNIGGSEGGSAVEEGQSIGRRRR
jgi:hypothetical protein